MNNGFNRARFYDSPPSYGISIMPISERMTSLLLRARMWLGEKRFGSNLGPSVVRLRRLPSPGSPRSFLVPMEVLENGRVRCFKFYLET